MPTGIVVTLQILLAAGALSLLLAVGVRRRDDDAAALAPVAGLLALWVLVTLLPGPIDVAWLGAIAHRLALALAIACGGLWLAYVARTIDHRRLGAATVRRLLVPAAAAALAALVVPAQPLGLVARVDGALGAGLAFWALALPYALALLALAALLLVDAAIHRAGLERAHAIALTLTTGVIGAAVVLQGRWASTSVLDASVGALAAAIAALLVTLWVFGGTARSTVAFGEVFRAMHEASFVIAPDGTILEANPAAARLLGETDLRARALLSTAPQLEVARRAVSGRQGRQALKGDLLGFEVSVSHLRDGRDRHRGTVLVVHDERREQAQAQRLREDAFRDGLTGIANRRGFESDVAEALAGRAYEAVGLAFIDLDGFKHINDTLGHAAGDTVLITVARRLECVLRDGDTVARLGGDEFALLLPGITPSGLSGVPARIAAELLKPIRAESTEVCIGASVGLASAPRDGRTLDALLEASDERMYRHKRSKAERVALTGEAAAAG